MYHDEDVVDLIKEFITLLPEGQLTKAELIVAAEKLAEKHPHFNWSGVGYRG